MKSITHYRDADNARVRQITCRTIIRIIGKRYEQAQKWQGIKRICELYTTSQSMLLYLYAAATSRNMEQMLSDLNAMMYAADESDPNSKMSVTVTSYLSGGKPINHYNSNNIGSRANNERYEAVSRPIQGYIRHLPAGQSASKEAKDRALALGFDLQPDETYVQPFIKNVLRLKENTTCSEYIL